MQCPIASAIAAQAYKIGIGVILVLDFLTLQELSYRKQIARQLHKH